MSSHDSLPTPRQFLTALLNSCPATTRATGHPPSNQLRTIASKDRSLLTTLHVLFPTPILLPALDLLDRQLVTRVVQNTTPDKKETHASQAEVHPPQAHMHLSPEPESDVEARADWRKEDYFYVVASASDVRSRGGRQNYGGASLEQRHTYVVKTGAWNCSCAAFTFSAYPGVMDDFHLDFEPGDDTRMGLDKDERIIEREENRREFGGVSIDGKDGGDVPCCKHLLACVLVERWEALFGQYVIESRVGKGEMAGLGAGVG